MKKPISSYEYEQKIIGTLLLFSEKASFIFVNTDEKRFSSQECKRIFLCLKTKWQQSGFYDLSCLSAEDMAYAADTMTIPLISDTFVKEYIKEVDDAYFRRKVRDETSDLAKICENQSKEETRKKLHEMLAEFPKNEMRKSKNEVLGEFISECEDVINFGRKLGIPTVDFLDEVILGVVPGQLNLIAGRTGTGKSALSMQIAVEMAKNKKNVLFFTLEMGHRACFGRMIAKQRRIQNWKIDKQLFTEKEYFEIIAGADFLREIPLEIDTNADATVSYIEQRIDEMEELDKKPDVIFIDYIQLMSHEDEKEGKMILPFLKVSDISRRLKKIAERRQIVIFGLAQLNRESARSKSRPQLHEFKDSGSLEQDADTAIVLWSQEEQEQMMNNHTPDIVISIIKNRNGQLSDIPVIFEKNYQNFKKQPL